MAQDPTNRPSAPSAPANEDMGGGNVDKFVQRALPAATRVAQKLDVPVEAVIGQWGLEVGWGKSVIPGTNNLGNIMDFSGKGVEAVDAKLKRKDKYRQYESVDAFADDFARLLSNQRYKSVPGTKDPLAYFQKLADSGYAEAKDYASTGVKATNMVAKSLQRSGAAPAVSRETPAPAKKELPPSLPPMAAAEESSAAPSKIAGLGAGYQAALALSFLADTDEKEDRDIDREPGVAEKWLAQQAPQSSALAEFADVKIRSPFAEPAQSQPQMLAHGGEVAHLASGGFPFIPSPRITSSARKQLDDIQAQYDTYNTQAADYNNRVDDYGRQVDAYNASVEAWNARRRRGPTPGEFTAVAPVAPTAPSTTPAQYEAMGKKAKRDATNRNLALQVVADPERFNLSMNRFFAEGGEVQLTPQQIERIAAQEAAEREIASKPAFLTPKSGKGRQISTKTGELEMAALQGVSEMPYNLLGAPVDLATMAMRPFGYDVEKPMGGSEDLKQRALDAGIRQKPPEGKAARALYELTQAGSSAVNPAAPVRGAVKAAEKTGEAAKMLAEDFMQYNRQLSVPGASYAVRNRGTPFMMGYGNKLTEGPDGKFLSMDQPEKYVKGEVATTMDDKLNEWLLNRVPAYLRRDFASPDDQFVKAADDNQLLHFVNKPMKRQDLDPYYDRAENISGIDSLPYVRQTEGFNPQGTAKTEYGKRVEDLTDVSAWPVQLEDITSPGLIPSSMRNMAETNPTARLTELGTNLDETLQLPELAADMAKMRRMPDTFSAYSQPPVKVPEEYLLTDEALGGLTLAQASNRVARFRNWEQDTRQKMASKFVNEDPNIDREVLPGGYKAAILPDLQDAPAYKELAMDVGCDGGWCTKAGDVALDYGSGDNRLHMIMDSKSRPMAQLTLSQINPTSAQRAADPGARVKFSITEIKGRNNSTDFANNPALEAIQKHVKSLDKEYNLRYVSELKALGMKELDSGELVKGAGELSRLRNRFRPGITAEEYEAAVMPDLGDLERTVRELNDGSKYITESRDTKALIQEALDILSPQQRATGGMVERQSTDSRKYL